MRHKQLPILCMPFSKPEYPDEYFISIFYPYGADVATFVWTARFGLN